MTDQPQVSLLSLPGPNLHLDEIAADLRSGLSCVWLVPDDLVAHGTADELLDELAARCDHLRPVPPVNWSRPRAVVAPTPVVAAPQLVGAVAVRPAWADDDLALTSWSPRQSAPVSTVVEEPGADLAQRLLLELGAEHGDEPGEEDGQDHGHEDGEGDGAAVDAVAALAASPRAGGKVIVVAAWQELDPDGVGSLVSRLLATTRGRPIGQRPRLLVGARIGDLPAALADRIDPLACRVHWWWGRTALPDTAVVVALSRLSAVRRSSTDYAQFLRELVAADVVAELAGPDLAMARALAMAWDGHVSTLPGVVDATAGGAGGPTRATVGGPVTADERRDRYWAQPPRALRPAWAAGDVDAWGGQVVVSLRVMSPQDRATECGRRLWRGQHRALTPLVDENRSLVERVFRARAGRRALVRIAEAGRRQPDDSAAASTALELKEMYWAVKDGLATMPVAHWTLLCRLYEARNALAHLRPLTDRQLDGLAEAVVRADLR
jgi:hypothetical protein